ncbi:MAG: PTS sugar transporter subunit IIA [Sphaerochaetaceae bacterium]|nr:PTS sugar transporter subunit IIA [Sphaerochaetaceae bacterium]
MNGIYSLINKSCILLDKQMNSIDEIIKTLTNQLNKSMPDIASTEFMNKVIKDGFHTTCMGNKCAITHARCSSMEKSLIAVMRLKPEINLQAPDKKNVKLIFLLVGPQKSSSYHLKILSRLARILSHESFRENLFNTPDAESFLNLIKQEEQ